MAVWGPPIEHGRLTAPFGEPRTSGPHLGTDIGPPIKGQRGIPVYAMGPGVVLRADYSEIRGYWVLIQHDDGSYSRYQHFNTPASVGAGARVAAGTVVGICGDLGTNVDGVHLHLEAYPAGPNPGGTQNSATDPESWALARGINLRALGALPSNPNPPEDDMPLNDVDKNFITTEVHRVVLAILRADEFKLNAIPAQVLAAKVDASTGTVAQTLRDARQISRRHEQAWRAHEGLPADPNA
jgi:hypothetical protein